MNDYRGWGQVTQTFQSDSGKVGAGTPSVLYGYDDYGRLITETYPGGREVDYTYSPNAADGTLGQVTAIGSGSTTYAQYTYLGDGTIVQVDHPNVGTSGLTMTYGVTQSGLDQFGRVSDITWKLNGTAVDEYGYTYDAQGNRTRRDNVLAPATINDAMSTLDQQYDYDALGRLVNADYGLWDGSTFTTPQNSSQTWGLDQLGNWSTFDNQGVQQTRSTDAANQIIGIVGGGMGTPGYDDAGNMTTDENGNTLTYDAWNRLVGVSGNIHYAYDGRGYRISKTTGTVGDWQRTDYYYNDNWQVVEERSAEVRNASTVATTTTYQYVPSLEYIDTPICRIDASGNLAYYAADANHNVTAMIGSAGTILERNSYTAFGQTTYYTADWSLQGGTGLATSIGNVITYCGYRFDSETGTFQVRNRQYNPSLGVWEQRDPAGYVDGANLAQYVGGSAVMRQDPSGLLAGCSPKPTPKGDRSKVDAALGKVHDAHKGYKYYQDKWLTGLSPLIWDKLHPVLWQWMREDGVVELPPTDPMLTSASAAFLDRHLYMPTTGIGPYTAFHELIHGYLERSKMYQSSDRDNEGATYAAMYMAQNLAYLGRFEDELNKKPLNVRAVAVAWQLAWGNLNMKGQYGQADGIIFEITEDDIRRAQKDLGVKVKIGEIADFYNKFPAVKAANIKFVTYPTKLPAEPASRPSSQPATTAPATGNTW